MSYVLDLKLYKRLTLHSKTNLEIIEKTTERPCETLRRKEHFPLNANIHVKRLRIKKNFPFAKDASTLSEEDITVKSREKGKKNICPKEN